MSGPTAAAVWVPPGLGQSRTFDAFWNALVSRAGMAVPLVGRAAAAFALAEAPAPGAVTMHLRCASGLEVLAVPVAFPFAALAGADLAAADLGVLPAPLRDALCEAILGVTTAVLPPGPLLPLAIDAVEPWDGTAPDGFAGADLRWFRAAVQGVAAEPLVFDLGATLPALAEIFGALPPRRVWSGLKGLLTFDAHVTLGRLALPLSALRGLTVGSVVVLEAALDPNRVALRCEGVLHRFERAAAGWACRSAEELEPTPAIRDRPMPDAPPDLPSPASAGRLDIRLDFDVGSIRVPLAELETWQAGSIVALRATPAARGVQVTLRSGGQVIGTGDLVTVDDRIAVRITHLDLA